MNIGKRRKVERFIAGNPDSIGLNLCFCSISVDWMLAKKEPLPVGKIRITQGKQAGLQPHYFHN